MWKLACGTRGCGRLIDHLAFTYTPLHPPPLNKIRSYLGYTAPHDPLQADPEFLAKCAGIPNRHRRAFCGMMAQLDAGVGNVTQVGLGFVWVLIGF